MSGVIDVVLSALERELEDSMLNYVANGEHQDDYPLSSTATTL